MHWARNARQKGHSRFVQANDLDPVAHFEICLYKLAHGLRRTAIRRGKTVDDMKYAHESPQKWL
jgi:hypothetical protein